MKLHILSTILFLSLGIMFLATPANHVSAQLGCEPITYGGTSSNSVSNSVWGWSYCFSGTAGDVLTITMVATSGDLDTYLELSDSTGAVLTSNDDADKASSNSLIEFTLPTTGNFSIYAGRYDKDLGKSTGIFLLSLSSSPTGATQTQPGRPTSNPSPTPTVCNNVAVGMDFIGASAITSTNQPLAPLDDNSITGWTSNGTSEELWFDVVLNGLQTVTSIEFNGFAPSGIPTNSINSFIISRWNAVTETFETLLDATALMQSGYQTYTIPPVTTESLTFFITTNHGGSIFEVADIKVCTDTIITGNTAGRPTASTTNTTQPVLQAVPCTVQAIDANSELRVGPGKNRSIVLYLSPDDIFEVIGTANDTDGLRWWRLDKTQAAPNKAAQVNETWVSDAHMTEFGDCESVGTVAAPRIIRAQPTAVPRPTTVPGGSSSGGNTSAPPQPTPQEGSTEPFVSFYTDFGTFLLQGECITLKWDVLNVKEIYFFDADTGTEKGVTGPSGSQEICPTPPTQTTLFTYELRVVPLSGEDIYRYIEVTVDGSGTTCPPYPFITEFGTLGAGQSAEYSVYVEPCDGSATVYIDVIKDSGDIDPYIDVYIDGGASYYGSDDDSGFDTDAFMMITIFEPTEIYTFVANLASTGSGEYTYSVYIE